jgi:chromosome segregation ATPase
MGRMLRIAIVFLSIIFLGALLPAHANGFQEAGRKIDRSLDTAGKWTQEKFHQFKQEFKHALHATQEKLNEARKKADHKAEKALDKTEKKLNELGRRLDDMDQEKEPDKKKAQELQADLDKTSQELEKK